MARVKNHKPNGVITQASSFSHHWLPFAQQQPGHHSLCLPLLGTNGLMVLQNIVKILSKKRGLKFLIKRNPWDQFICERTFQVKAWIFKSMDPEVCTHYVLVVRSRGRKWSLANSMLNNCNPCNSSTTIPSLNSNKKLHGFPTTNRPIIPLINYCMFL